MKLRSLLLGPAIALGLAAFAQPVPPYDMTINGYVLGCIPNGYVNILTVQGTEPALDIDVPLDANCGFSIDLAMDSYQGWFQISTPCNGAIQQTSVPYTFNAFFPDSNMVWVYINCDNTVTDCLGNPGGSALPGTPCTNLLGQTGTWSADCQCVVNAGDCNACFTVAQTGASPGDPGTPWSMTATNCSSSSSAPPYSYVWTLSDGTVSAAAEPVFNLTSEGAYILCLTLMDNNGCESTTCDSVFVDAAGIINPVNVVPCQSSFFVMQAYQWVDSAANPNGGGGEPIPNELWLWNLSNGGTGNFQFTWSWGDGTSSNTAFPSHTYASSGTYTICLTIYDNAGCTSVSCQDITVDGVGILGGFMSGGNRATVTINVINPLTVGMTELPTLSGLNAWPNPVNDVLNVTLESRFKGNLRIAITDLSGRVVATDTRSINDGRNNLSLPVNELNAGLYVISISNGTTAVSERFVKVR